MVAALRGGNMRLRLSGLATLLFLVAGPAWAQAPCEALEEAGARYVVCRFDAARDDLRLFWNDARGERYGSFGALAGDLAKQGRTLAFAMNAGMYDPDYAPVGLYIENGVVQRPANLRDASGNFHLKPNGVFFVGAGRAGVMETGRFLRTRPAASLATQSGPMLVAGGRIHPRIRPTGVSAKIRNGVGVADGRRVMFAISNQPVTFHAFASLFRDRLGCPDALFLDGSISGVYAPNLQREDRWRPMGPIVGVVAR